MKYAALLALLLAIPASASAQKPSRVLPPRLTNRDEIVRERDAASRRLLARGDSQTVKVFMLIDERGIVVDPEVKDVVDDRLKAAAIGVVRKMRFTPAQSAGKPKAVLLTVPVKFVHPRER